MAIQVGEFRAKMDGWNVDDIGDKEGILDSGDRIQKPNNNRGGYVDVSFEEGVEAFYQARTDSKKTVLERLRDQFVTDANLARWSSFLKYFNFGVPNHYSEYRVVLSDLYFALRDVDPAFATVVKHYIDDVHSIPSVYLGARVRREKAYIKLLKKEFKKRLA